MKHAAEVTVAAGDIAVEMPKVCEFGVLTGDTLSNMQQVIKEVYLPLLDFQVRSTFNCSEGQVWRGRISPRTNDASPTTRTPPAAALDRPALGRRRRRPGRSQALSVSAVGERARAAGGRGRGEGRRAHARRATSVRDAATPRGGARRRRCRATRGGDAARGRDPRTTLDPPRDRDARARREVDGPAVPPLECLCLGLRGAAL
jgi:hypothetical protein